MATDRVILNVGGTLFESTRDTLNKSPYLSALLQPYWKEAKVQEPLFIDRDPKIFRHILCLLRDSNYPYPNKYNSELDFYLINLYDDQEVEKDPEPLEALTKEVALTNLSSGSHIASIIELLSKGQYDEIIEQIRPEKPRIEINHIIDNDGRLNTLCLDEIKELWLQVELKGDYNLDKVKSEELGKIEMFSGTYRSILSIDTYLLWLYQKITHSQRQLLFEDSQTVLSGVLHIQIPLWLRNYSYMSISSPFGVRLRAIDYKSEHIKSIKFDVQGYIYNEKDRIKDAAEQCAEIFMPQKFEFIPDAQTGIVNSNWDIRGSLAGFIVIARDTEGHHQIIDRIEIEYMTNHSSRSFTSREIITKMLRNGLNFRDHIYYVSMECPINMGRMDRIDFRAHFPNGSKIKDVIVYAFIGNIYTNTKDNGPCMLFI